MRLGFSSARSPRFCCCVHAQGSSKKKLSLMLSRDGVDFTVMFGPTVLLGRSGPSLPPSQVAYSSVVTFLTSGPSDFTYTRANVRRPLIRKILLLRSWMP